MICRLLVHVVLLQYVKHEFLGRVMVEYMLFGTSEPSFDWMKQMNILRRHGE
jgi:hypothetical protein